MTRIEEKLDKLLGLSRDSRRRSSTRIPSVRAQAAAASPQSVAGADAETNDELVSACARRFGSVHSSASLPGGVGNLPNEMQNDGCKPVNIVSQNGEAKRSALVCTLPDNASSCYSNQEILTKLAKLDKDAQTRFAELERCIQALVLGSQVQDLQRHEAGSTGICKYSADSAESLAQTSKCCMHALPGARKLTVGSKSSTEGSFDDEHKLDSIHSDGNRKD